MTPRRWLAGLNTATAVVLLAVLFIFVNFIASRRYIHKDVSRSQMSAVSDKTVRIVKQLNQPVRVVVFYQPKHWLFQKIRDLLKEYERVSPTIQVEYVDPDQDLARAEQLVKQYEINLQDEKTNLVIFESGVADGKGTPRRKFLSDTDLAEIDYAAMTPEGAPTVKAFKGEDAFTSAILNVTQKTQPLIWIAQGHGEKALEAQDPGGLAQLGKFLERENMKSESANLLERKEIPNTVSAIVIAGPTRRFAEQELLALEAYLRGGGRLLAMIDPMTNTGLDGLLSKWGAELGNDVVVDPARQLPFVSPANLLVTTYTSHPLVQHMETLMTLFPLARSVRPLNTRPGISAQPLALTSPQGWGESTPQNPRFEFNRGVDAEGPVPIALASEAKAPGAARLVVVGDSDFASDAQITNAGNGDFVMAAFHWLVGQEQLIGIGPKTITSIKVSLTKSQVSQLFWISLVGLPGVMAALGIGMWWRRRA